MNKIIEKSYEGHKVDSPFLKGARMINRLIQSLFSLILFAFFLIACTPSTPPPATTGAIEGKVFCGSSTPVINATVALNDATQTVAKTETSKEGQYSFTKVNPGTYTLSISWKTKSLQNVSFSTLLGWTVIVTADPQGSLASLIATSGTFSIVAGHVYQSPLLDVGELYCLSVP